MDKLTIPEAAARLGLSENAIRKRVHRGTIEHEKDEEGRVYVYLSPDMPPTRTDQADDQAGDQAIDQAGDLFRLISRLEDEVEYLRREAEDWKEEARRKDTIIMTMAQRIPELEPVQEPRESPDTVSEGTEGVEGPLKEERRSWLYRFFFGS